jgi:hypothetical protein
MRLWATESKVWYSTTSYGPQHGQLFNNKLCFILHKVSEMHNETIPDELAEAVQIYDREFQPSRAEAPAQMLITMNKVAKQL